MYSGTRKESLMTSSSFLISFPLRAGNGSCKPRTTLDLLCQQSGGINVTEQVIHWELMGMGITVQLQDNKFSSYI